MKNANTQRIVDELINNINLNHKFLKQTLEDAKQNAEELIKATDDGDIKYYIHMIARAESAIERYKAEVKTWIKQIVILAMTENDVELQTRAYGMRI